MGRGCRPYGAERIDPSQGHEDQRAHGAVLKEISRIEHGHGTQDGPLTM